MTILYPQRFFHRVVGNAYAADRKRKRIRDASIYTSKKISLKLLFLSDIFLFPFVRQ